jgi:uncharacterized protein (DUF433 family)
MDNARICKQTAFCLPALTIPAQRIILTYSVQLVTKHPEVVSGTPCFARTRVPVKSLFDWLANGHTLNDFLENFPSVTREQAQGVLSQANNDAAAHAQYAEPVKLP